MKLVDFTRSLISELHWKSIHYFVFFPSENFNCVKAMNLFEEEFDVEYLYVSEYKEFARGPEMLVVLKKK